jgi:hypothetical protein
MRLVLVPFVSLLLLAFLAGEARSCSIPVFRYALERWKSSPYTLHVLHDRDLSAAQAALLARIEGNRELNIEIVRLDSRSTLTAEQQSLFQQHRANALPLLVAHYPGEDVTTPAPWVGPLTQESLDALLNSPIRQEIVKRLCNGDSSVWILLDADDATAKMVDAELLRLAGTLKIPEQTEESKLTDRLPLKVRFSTLRLERTTKGEHALIGMLLGVEEGLVEVQGPILVPIFGRGRALTGIHGKNLNKAQIERWASFLCGPCSCQVKELNPGVDLLIQTDWNERLALAQEEGEENPSPSPTAPAIPKGIVTPPAEEISGPKRPTWQFWGLLALAGAGVGLWLWRGGRR